MGLADNATLNTLNAMKKEQKEQLEAILKELRTLNWHLSQILQPPGTVNR